MRLPIDIDTPEDRLAFDLFDAITLAVGVSITLPGDAVLTFRGVGNRGDRPDAPGTLRLELSLDHNADAGRAAAWLCARIQGRATALRVGGASVEVDPAKVEYALSQHAKK